MSRSSSASPSRPPNIQIAVLGPAPPGTVHSVTAFLVNTLIVALTVNPAVSLLG